MSWGLVAVGVGSLGAGLLGSKSSDKASEHQQAGAMAGIESQERMFDKSLELQEPYREAGYGALEGLQGLTEQDYRAEKLQGYYDGPEYQALSGQVEEQQLRNAAVPAWLIWVWVQLHKAQTKPCN